MKNHKLIILTLVIKQTEADIWLYNEVMTRVIVVMLSVAVYFDHTPLRDLCS